MPHSVSSDSDREGLGILDIPFEILLKILKHVQNNDEYHYIGSRDDRLPESVNDIKNCRLTCTRFNEAASQLLVQTVEIDCSLKSLDRIEQIANHPTISKGVRTVQVCLREYPMDIARHMNDFIVSSTLTLNNACHYMRDEVNYQNLGQSKRFPVLPQEPRRLEQTQRLIETWRRIFAPGSRRLPSANEEEDGDDRSVKPQAGDTLHRRLATQAFQEYQMLHYIQEAILEDRDEDDDHGIPQFLPRVATALARLPCLRNLAFTPYSPTKIYQKAWERLLTDTATDFNTIIYQGVLLEPADGRFMRQQSIPPSLGHVIPRLLTKLSDARHLHPDHTSRLELLEIDADDVDIRSFAMSPSMLSKVSSELRLLKYFTFSAMSQTIINNMREPILVGSETVENSVKINQIINEDIMNDFLEIPLASPALECFDVTLTPPHRGFGPHTHSHVLATPPGLLNIGPALLSRKIPLTGANNNIRLFKLSGVSFHEKDLGAFLDTVFPPPGSSSSSSSVSHPPTAPQDTPAWPPVITTRLKLIKSRLLSGKWSTALTSLRDARRRIGPSAIFTVREPEGGSDLMGWDRLRVLDVFKPKNGVCYEERPGAYTILPLRLGPDDFAEPFAIGTSPFISPCWEYLNEHIAMQGYVMDMYRAQYERRGTADQQQIGEGREWTVEEIREFLTRNPPAFPNPVFWDPNEPRPPLPYQELFGDDDN